MLPLKRALLALMSLALAPQTQAKPLAVDLQVDRPLISSGREEESLILRLGLKAGKKEGRTRAPLNLALVLDRSGSMHGGKIARLREAARHAIDRMRPDDILSIVAFDTQARVLLPASRLGNARAALEAVNALEPEGSTALYAGVARGLSEARKHQGKGRVSRLILLSDGLANVGPSSPQEVAGLGREAGAIGVPVTTFGLGMDFGEDLMTRLALASDGNHAFIPDEGGLAAYFDKEMGEALAVTARDITIEVTLKPGVRYKSSLDREVEVKGNTIRWKLNQISGGSEKRLLLEVQAPSLSKGEAADLAEARVLYSDAEGGRQAALEAKVGAKGAGPEEAKQAQVTQVVAEAALARANLKREEAIQLRDQGRAAEAAQVLAQNAQALDDLQKSSGGAAGLSAASQSYKDEAAEVAAPSADWNSTRKSMKAKSHSESTQQSY